MKICAKYNRCTLVVRPQIIDGVQYYMGSGRGKRAEGFNSLREFLLDSNLVEMAQGHAMAHGVSIKEENIDKLIEYANNTLSNIDFGSEVVEVCGINPPTQALYDFATHNWIYGNGIPQPTFAFIAIAPQNYTVMGSKSDTVKFKIGDVTFIKFHAKELIAQLSNKGINKIIIIGRPQINEYMGNKTLQVVIDNFEIKKHELI